MTESNDTYAIPSWNMGKLTKKIDSLNRRAAKIGTPAITLETVGERKVVAPGYEEQMEIMGADWCPKITVYDVRVTGEGPKIDGWKFLGTLDHITLPGSVIINTVPGEKIPEQFHTADGSCDHCGKIRRRNETFVLENEEGEYQMVGRQCVRDFIGYDVGQILGQMTRLRTLLSDMDDEDRWFSGGGHQDYVFDHDKILKTTAAVIERNGWVPRSAAGEGRVASADRVLSIFIPPKFFGKYAAEQQREYREWVDSLDLDNEKWMDEAKASHAWLKEQDSNNEYMHNLHAIDGADAVPSRMFGYWCSLVAAYQRAQERLRLAEQQKKLNEHYGNLKDRVEIEIEVVSKRYIEGYYGTVCIVKMLDNDGRTIMWFANTTVDMDKGEKYRIKGTIKKHDEYNGWKQTHLSRVAVLEEIDA